MIFLREGFFSRKVLSLRKEEIAIFKEIHAVML
jgi:hypothetical protein